MQLQINSEKIDKNFDSNLSLSEIVSDYTKDLKLENKVICKIIVNGKSLDEREEDEALKIKVGETESLVLLTEKIDTLIINSLTSLENLLPELTKVINNVATLFRSGETTKGNNLFATALDALELVPKILDGVKNAMSGNFSELIIEGKALKDLEKNMFTTIKSLFEAQQIEDMVCLSDMLEYELNPNLSDWQSVIPKLKEICTERAEN